MKKLRSHIFKIGIITLVCSGLMISFAQPANASQSNEEFADWLQSLTKKADAPQLQQELRSLKKADADISQLIQRASRIISENDEDFNIPLKANSHNLEQILLVEWNEYQSGNSMTAVPVVETAKLLVAPQFQKLAVPGFLLFDSVVESRPSRFVSIWWFADDPQHDFNTAPMISGIAIGAP